MVHQNFMLVPSFTIAENIVLGSEPRKGRFVDRNQAIAVTEELSRAYGLQVDPTARIEVTPVGMRQRVEILKTLYRGADLLILDEPTAVLTPQETDELFLAVRKLVDQGKTVIFITHKLVEVKEISDRVTVMRHGEVTGRVATRDVSEADIARMMVGRAVFLQIDKTAAAAGARRRRGAQPELCGRNRAPAAARRLVQRLRGRNPGGGRRGRQRPDGIGRGAHGAAASDDRRHPGGRAAGAAGQPAPRAAGGRGAHPGRSPHQRRGARTRRSPTTWRWIATTRRPSPAAASSRLPRCTPRRCN
jgi:energy-coupling factor transporter ATP-binding protein EcfA2